MQFKLESVVSRPGLFLCFDESEYSPLIEINGGCHLEGDTQKIRLWILSLSESHHH